MLSQPIPSTHVLISSLCLESSELLQMEGYMTSLFMVKIAPRRVMSVECSITGPMTSMSYYNKATILADCTITSFQQSDGAAMVIYNAKTLKGSMDVRALSYPIRETSCVVGIPAYCGLPDQETGRHHRLIAEDYDDASDRSPSYKANGCHTDVPIQLLLTRQMPSIS